MKKQVIPAIISDNQRELDQMIASVKEHVLRIQLDFMDGVFVETRSLDFDFQLPAIDPEFEAHLMVSNPKEWVDAHGHKVDIVLPHLEALEDEADFEAIKEICQRKKTSLGLVLSPQTPVAQLEPYINDLTQVLVMTVQPGKYGAKFLPEMLEKIRILREKHPKLDLEVDGGMTSETVEAAVSAGANLICSGSYIMRNPSPQKAVKRMLDIIGGSQ